MDHRQRRVSEQRLRSVLVPYRVVRALVFVFMAAVAAANVYAPGPTAQRWRLIALAGITVVTGLGPWLRGLRTFALGGSIALATLLTLGGIVVTHGQQPLFDAVGPSGYAYTLGYALFGVWFVGVHRYLGLTLPRQLLVSATLTMITGLIALWSVPSNVPGRPLDEIVQWTVYPIIGAVAVTLTWHMAYNYGRSITAFRWLFAGMVAEFVVAFGFSTVWIVFGTEPGAATNIVYFVPFFLFASAATHPTLWLLRPGYLTDHAETTKKGTSWVYLLIFPGYASLALPAQGGDELIIRYVLVGALVLVLLSQLLATVYKQRRTEERSARRAAHDHLTGLLNRHGLFEELGPYLSHNRPEKPDTAVFFLDCDNFKNVNDTWGHQAGDNVLREIAARLKHATRDGDLTARHGGDEFIVVCLLSPPETAGTIAARLIDHLTRTVEVLPGHTHEMSVSVGAALAEPDDLSDPMRLIGRADAALYEAKALTKATGEASYVVWDEHLAAHTAHRSRLHQALRTAVAEEHFTVELQPVRTRLAHTGFGTTYGYEALARWDDPELGTVPRSEFVPLAAELDLLGPLGNSIMRQAFEALAALRRAGHPVHAIAVNAYPTQLEQPGFEATLLDALARNGLAPTDVWLEIPEHALMSATVAFDVLHRLRTAGVHVCLDEFGSHHASLTGLHTLPIDCVKIDHALASPRAPLEEAAALHQHLIDMLELFGTTHVVLAGIDTAEQAELLDHVSCDFTQGAWFSPPAPLEHWLAAQTEAGADEGTEVASRTLG